MKRPCPREPRFVVESSHIDDERVAFEMSYGITHVAGQQIIRMFRVQGNDTVDVHVLIKHDDLGRGLHNLLRKKTEHDCSRDTGRQTFRRRVVDAAPVESFEYLLRSPRLIGSAFAAGGTVIRRKHDGSGRISAAASNTGTRICFFPVAALRTPALPHTGEIGLPIRHPRNAALLLSEQNGGQQSDRQNR